MNALVSVIIPVYNVEKYIGKCIQSLLDQTYDNFEAIIIDDGSPDNSITVAKSIVSNDPRFIFLQKENGGQGTARNLALDYAKGDYITFLDSDDYYDHKLLEVIIEEFRKDISIDVLTFGINQVDETGVLLDTSSSCESKFNTNKDVLLLNGTTTHYFCDKAFKKEAIYKFRFSEVIRTYEDVDLMYQVLYGLNVRAMPECLYNYTQRSGSTTHSLRSSFIQDKVEIVTNAKLFLEKNKIFRENNDYYISYYLIEMFYKPLIKIALYSDDYKNDINKLMNSSNHEMLSFKNIMILKSYYDNKAVLSLTAFKLNKKLFRSIVKFKFLIKGRKTV